MKELTASEKKVKKYYDNFWSVGRQVSHQYLNVGFHYGLYEKNIKTLHDATRNMNTFVGKCLELEQIKAVKVLDAGCGIGATSLHLAKKYPHAYFTGITLASTEVKLAKSKQKEKNVTNAEFLVGNYTNTGFPNNSFDGVFALESLVYAVSKKDVIQEISRVIKPGGKVVIIDGFFRKNFPLNSFMQNIYVLDLKKRVVPYYASLDELRACLETMGFTKITIHDLSKNIAGYYLYGGILYGFVNLLKSGVKNKIIRKKEKQKRDSVSLIKGVDFIEFLLGITNKIGYYAITATKKETDG
jgi:ubiquinone/menaquinone biosynthesis C-methylase UbiE